MIEWKWTNNIIMKIRVNPDFNYEILDAALEFSLYSLHYLLIKIESTYIHFTLLPRMRVP